MDRIVIVGSGASGVHFALSVLKKGYRVLMLDVGYQRPGAVNPDDDFRALRSNLSDPAAYFLGPKYESLILPGYGAEYYGFPPNKSYVFLPTQNFQYRAEGFAPLVSFAAGGLAEAWTGGSYPFRDGELDAFPFSYREIGPYYDEVARRIGISGVADDLARFFPVHDGLLEPLDLDEHSALLLDTYTRRKERLNRRLRCFVGRARVAALSRDLGDRKRCDYSGRCLWGCPSDSLYTPSVTLRECLRYEQFEYIRNLYVHHFRFNAAGRVTGVVAVSAHNGRRREFEAGTLVLAAGALCSSQIFLQSIYQDSGERVELRGLMDNRQVLMPFVNLKMLGKRYNPKTYQYHQVAIGIEGERPIDYVHGLVTTLKTAMIHPVVQSLPFDLGTGISVFRNLHAALGLVNINFADGRREENYLALEPGGLPGNPRLSIYYRPDAGEPERLRKAINQFRRALWILGCFAPPPMTHLRPMGASVHYAGTIPMSPVSSRLTCSKYCRSHDFENLYFVDGTTFPALPAKNLTFTLMANATRVAEEAF